MAGKFCVDCADCVRPAHTPTSNKFRCVSPRAVGPHHEPMGEAPRPFGVEAEHAPSCNEMRNPSSVFPTCGPNGDWFRTEEQKPKLDEARHLASVKALAKAEDAQRQAAAEQPTA